MNKRKKTLKVILFVFGLFILPVFCEGQNIDIKGLLIKCKERYEVQKKILEQEGFNVIVEEDSYSEDSEKEATHEKIIRNISFSSGKWKTISEDKNIPEDEEPFFVFEYIDTLYNILQDPDYIIKYQQENLVGSYSCHLLYFEPKKKEEDSMKGQVWIEKESNLIIKAISAPAKLPFWVKKNDYNLSFVKINKLWLPQNFIIKMKLSIPLFKTFYHHSNYQFYGWKIGVKK
jgi:hypothetical protein